MPDDLSLAKAVLQADDGESGYTLTDGVDKFWVHDPWLEISMDAQGALLDWATGMNATPSGYWSRDEKDLLEKPLKRAIKRLQHDTSAWRKSRENDFTLGDLRRSATTAAK